MSKKVCIECGKEEPDRLKRKLCKRCYNRYTAHKNINILKNNFNSLWSYNNYIFNLYLEHICSRIILYKYVAIVRKLGVALQTKKIAPLQDWIDVYELSDELAIGYSPHKNKKGCPIIMIGNLLADKNEIKAEEKAHEFHLIYQLFPPPVKGHIKEYVEYLKSSLQTTTILKYLRALKGFYIWLNGSLYDVTAVSAKNYLARISSYQDIIDFLTTIRMLKRFYKWVLDNELSATNPFDLDLKEWKRVCPRCEKIKITPRDGEMCCLCHNDKALSKSISVFKAKLNDVHKYNKYLFDIYYKYIKRYRVNGDEWIAAKLLTDFLSKRKIRPLLSWSDVNNLASDFKIFVKKKNRNLKRGCPIYKIGHMLAELHVILPRGQDKLPAFEHNVKKLGWPLEGIMRDYAQSLLHRKRSYSTIVQITRSINYFQKWLIDNYSQNDIFEVDEKTILNYLDFVGSGISDHYRGSLNSFYRWCCKAGITNYNPLENIKTREAEVRNLTVCSKEDLQGILKYMKNDQSDPCQAMMLALIIFWGFSKKELIYSIFEVIGDYIEINIYCPKPSYAYRSPKRDYQLKLPKTPKWFFELQQRFITEWNKRFTLLNNPGPRRPLFILPSGLHNRPLVESTIYEEVIRATTTAVGKGIPPRILKMTAGHLHTYQNDSSLLSQLGWSRSYSFKYSWLPRKYY